MSDAINKLARILRISPETLLNFDEKMRTLRGQEGVIEGIARQNEQCADQTLNELGLTIQSLVQAHSHVPSTRTAGCALRVLH